MSFINKRVIVTGANRSLGRDMAVAFAKEGADIVISYRSDKEGAMETAKQIKATGRNCLALYADFSTMENVAAFAKEAILFLGQVDILINNAGTLCRERLFELSPEKMQQVFQINTVAPLYLTQLCTQDMIAKKNQGCVINISSIAGTTTMAKGIGYASSKAAMNKWTKNAALDLAEHHIRVNAIAPGVVESGMNENTAVSNPELWKFYMEKIPLQRPGAPSDITNMALYLASDKAAWITGKTYEVDGGHVL